MKEKRSDLEARLAAICRGLRKQYPDAKCALNHSSPVELLIATIMSAQCTDERVNIVTATLFRKYRSCNDYVSVSQAELEKDINSVTFFRNKAKAIQGACQILIDKYQCEVPRTVEELIELPGVGRKTANVVMGNAFGIPSGVVVDTHVMRLSQRLRLTDHKQPEKIEVDLMNLLQPKLWIDFSHWLILHGRQICKARKPACDKCTIEKFCPSSSLKLN
ncbi:MAG: endonuclease III [Acidobacteria bacterium]|nr:endonuclease III [Acidobacteriota bacterium]